MVIITKEGNLTYLTLNRAEKRNALSPELVQSLHQALQDSANDPHCRVIIIRALGEAFCAGADLAYLQKLQSFTYKENLEDSLRLKALFQCIYEHPKMIIAEIQGHALAGGCGLASVCDFSFSVPEANFGYTEVKIGFIPAIVMIFLIRKIGEGSARSLLLSGKLINANKALQLGLINEVVSADLLADTVKSFAQKIAKETSPESIRITKKMMAHAPELPLSDALYYAAEQNALARAGNDCKKGINAFLNKEKITWP